MVYFLQARYVHDMRMGKKRKESNLKIGRLIVIIIIFLLSLPVVFAETGLFVEFSPESVISVNVFDNNEYYSALFDPVAGFYEDNEMIAQLVAVTESNVTEVLVEQEIDSDFYGLIIADLKTLAEADAVRIFNSSVLVAERGFDLCNNNGICEQKADVVILAENYLVCGDCEANAQDNYCSLSKDGICDPDCVPIYDCDECNRECLDEEEGYFPVEIASVVDSSGEIAPPAIPEDRQGMEGEAGAQAAFPDEANALLSYAIVLFVAVTLVLSVLFFRKRAAEKESLKMQDEINNLLKQRYSYPQIRIILSRRGFSSYSLDREIRKNYDLWRAKNR